jgi:hypothetical protein
MTNYVTKPIPTDKPPVGFHRAAVGIVQTIRLQQDVTVSLMTVKPGMRLSLQSHTGRAELWIVLDEGCEVQVGEKILHPHAGDEIWIPGQHTTPPCQPRAGRARAGGRLWQLAAGRHHPLRRRFSTPGTGRMTMTLPNPWRKTTQHLMPARLADANRESVAGQYDIYPTRDLGVRSDRGRLRRVGAAAGRRRPGDDRRLPLACSGRIFGSGSTWR